MPFIPALERQGQVDLGELEAFLVYIVRPTARPPALHSVTLSQEKVKNKVILCSTKENKHRKHKHRPLHLSLAFLVSGKDNTANRSKDISSLWPSQAKGQSCLFPGCYLKEHDWSLSLGLIREKRGGEKEGKGEGRKGKRKRRRGEQEREGERNRNGQECMVQNMKSGQRLASQTIPEHSQSRTAFPRCVCAAFVLALTVC